MKKRIEKQEMMRIKLSPLLATLTLTPHLSQSKSYLKIIGIPYLVENTNVPINSSYIENIIKNTYFFNNVILVSYYIPSSPVWRIHLYGNTAFSTSTIQSLSSMMATFLATHPHSSGIAI